MSQGRSARAYWLPSLSKHTRTLPSPLLATSHLSSPSGPAQGKVLGVHWGLGSVAVSSVSSRVNCGYSASVSWHIYPWYFGAWFIISAPTRSFDGEQNVSALYSNSFEFPGETQIISCSFFKIFLKFLQFLKKLLSIHKTLAIFSVWCTTQYTLCLSFKKNLFIYLTVPGLSWVTRDLPSSLQHTGSFSCSIADS